MLYSLRCTQRRCGLRASVTSEQPLGVPLLRLDEVESSLCDLANPHLRRGRVTTAQHR